MKEFHELDPNTQDILLRIAHECEKAETKHPEWPSANEDNHIIAAAAILCEESGELIRAAVQYDREGGQLNEVAKEAIQTGAMALRLLKNLAV